MSLFVHKLGTTKRFIGFMRQLPQQQFLFRSEKDASNWALWGIVQKLLLVTEISMSLIEDLNET
jgi:hypothetical protein